MAEDMFRVGKARPDAPKIEQPPYAGTVIPEVPFRWILSGPSRSGKTNLARWMLDHFYSKGKKSFFDSIYLLSPTAAIDYTWADLPGLKPENRISRPSESFLVSILDKQKKKIQGSTSDTAAQRMSSKSLAKRRVKAPKILLIFDDAIAEKMIHSAAFLKVFIAGRHYLISSMIMSQSYVKVPRSCRIQATHCCMFPSRNSECVRLWEEHGPRQLSKNQFVELVKYATMPSVEDPYPFLYVDCFAPAKTRFRRGLTGTLEISEGGEEEISKPKKKRKL